MSTETRDAALTIGLVLAFSILVATHVATLFGLVRKRYLGAALGAFLIPPAAPYLALRRGMQVRAFLWLAGAAIYVALFLLAR
jgi:hypothetical protein